MFVLAGLGLVVLMAVVYGQVWHFGMVFLAWIFAFWIAALRTRPGWLANASLVSVLAFHAYWFVCSFYQEVTTSYSAGRETAGYLASQHIPETGLYGVGYASVAVQPYFERNIFTKLQP